VEKKKYNLCLEVLRRMQGAGILNKILLVGSWCVFLYKDYFEEKTILPPLRTRDVEFLFPIPFHLKKSTDLYDLLKDLGFVLDYKGNEGYISFQHPELIMEFLAPARGKESDKPVAIDQLGINAQALRFVEALARDPIQLNFDDVTVTLPHPVDFALHKLLIAGRRKNKDKAEKDRNQAIALLRALIDAGEIDIIRSVYNGLPKPWQKTIRQELLALGEEQILGKIY